MKKPKTATAEISALITKAEQPIATFTSEEESKPKKPVALKSPKPSAEAPKPASDANAGKPAQLVAAKPKPKPKQASITQKLSNKPNSVTPKQVPEAKTEQPIATAAATEAKPKKPVVKKPSKPKAIATKPAAETKAGQPAASVAKETKPKKASATQKIQNRTKAVPPKAEVPALETTKLEDSSSPTSNIWPSWVENFLRSFGVKKG